MAETAEGGRTARLEAKATKAETLPATVTQKTAESVAEEESKFFFSVKYRSMLKYLAAAEPGRMAQVSVTDA
jgi:hypothetical protein